MNSCSFKMRRFVEVLLVVFGCAFLILGAGVPVLARRPAWDGVPATEENGMRRYPVGELVSEAVVKAEQSFGESDLGTAERRSAMVDAATRMLRRLPIEQVDPKLVEAFGGALSAQEFLSALSIQGPNSVESFLDQSDAVSRVQVVQLCGNSTEQQSSSGALLFDPKLHSEVAERLGRNYRNLPDEIVTDVSQVWLRAIGAKCLVMSLKSTISPGNAANS